MNYQIFTDATSDLDEALLSGLPHIEIIPMDTLCASVGLGFLVMEAARRQTQGMAVNELVYWVDTRRLNICHWFTVDTFKHLQHGGRVSAVSAMAGTVLNIKPLLHVNEEGKLDVAAKPRGSKQALKMKLQHMEQGWNPKMGNLVIIGHGDDIESAKKLNEEVSSQFPEAEIFIANIGPVIGSHTGPNMIALIYWGNNR